MSLLVHLDHPVHVVSQPAALLSIMRVGLVRHFAVDLMMPSGWVSAQELKDWMRDYDSAPVKPVSVELGQLEWHRCFCSDLPRALTTAEAIFSGPITVKPELREMEFDFARTPSLRMPLLGWRCLLRLQWIINHSSQRTARTRLVERVRRVAKEIIAENHLHTLVVSHGGIMPLLRKELLQVGFRGPPFNLAQNAYLYTFERR